MKIKRVDREIEWKATVWEWERNARTIIFGCDIEEIEIEEIVLCKIDKIDPDYYFWENLEYEDKIPLGLTVARFFNDNPNKIPKKWAGKKIIFSGTVKIQYIDGRYKSFLFGGPDEEYYHYYCLTVEKNGKSAFLEPIRVDHCKRGQILAAYPDGSENKN